MWQDYASGSTDVFRDIYGLLGCGTPDTLMRHDWLKRGRNAEAVGLSIGFSLVREVVPCGASQFFGRTV